MTGVCWENHLPNLSKEFHYRDPGAPAPFSYKDELLRAVKTLLAHRGVHRPGGQAIESVGR